MTTRKTSRRIALILGLIVISPSAQAGPCTDELDALQPKVDARVDAAAGAGKFAPESKAATTHQQPTPDSIAAAEARLNEGKRAREAVAALDRARKADAAGDSSACEAAVIEVRAALGP
jgi:hypothetical protein